MISLIVHEAVNSDALFSINILISNFRNKKEESLFQCGGYLDRQIKMEPVVIDWAKEEAKMAKNHSFIFLSR